MYKFYINKITNDHHYEELVKVFLRREEYEIVMNFNKKDITVDDINSFLINDVDSIERDEILRELYIKLTEITGHEHLWGSMIGVRPLKPAINAFELTGDLEKAKEHLKAYYILSDKKANMLIDILEYQMNNVVAAEENTVGIYIGIPFCPSRCAYCSFTSNIAKTGEVDRYLEALIKEIEYIGRTGLKPESIYIGGGTPSVLDENQLELLVGEIKENIDLSGLKEYSFEAGRPDTVSIEKLKILKKYDIERISINPQTFSQDTLVKIGRNHSVDGIYRAYDMAKEVGFKSINSDIIAGLPDEEISDFENTVDKIIQLNPENVTVHSLAVKKGSKLEETNPNYYRNNGELVMNMLDLADKKLKENGYSPYYIYRQKHMAGALENIGYQRDKTHCIYNIRIMNERQSIIALGAGGASKIYFPSEERHERVPNVSNYEVYIARIEDMINRKKGYLGGN
ncbi:MAG: coproporphyrinogen dehydrogenase HemZ [Peptostreptococcaceae bacterium]|nr:coproporphyrinogen dehydrogenase HemZ [Peptostreptococcaceae bacterium]